MSFSTIFKLQASPRFCSEVHFNSAQFSAGAGAGAGCGASGGSGSHVLVQVDVFELGLLNLQPPTHLKWPAGITGKRSFGL